jgi:hypothetical protein
LYRTKAFKHVDHIGLIIELLFDGLVTLNQTPIENAKAGCDHVIFDNQADLIVKSRGTVDNGQGAVARFRGSRWLRRRNLHISVPFPHCRQFVSQSEIHANAVMF